MRVRWTVPAADDLASIKDYLQRHYPQFAASTVRTIYQRIRSLKTSPYRGRPLLWLEIPRGLPRDSRPRRIKVPREMPRLRSSLAELVRRLKQPADEPDLKGHEGVQDLF